MSLEKEQKEQPSKLTVSYSPESELERVQYVVSPEKRKFYLERKYRVKLPTGVDLEQPETITDEKIEEQIKQEYNEQTFQEAEQIVHDSWPQIVERLNKIFVEIGYEPLADYQVNLTRYGTGGSYHWPNGIVFNITNATPERYLKIIAHEAVHLAIDPLIKKYQVSHWVKERVVDLLMLKAFPEYPVQKLPIPTETIDSLFNQNYPDLDKILLQLSDKEKG